MLWLLVAIHLDNLHQYFVDIENIFLFTQNIVNNKLIVGFYIKTYDVYNFNLNAIMFLVPIKSVI